MKWACFRSSEIWPNQHSYFKIILPLYMIISLLHWILFYEKMEIYSIFARLKCIFYHIINFSYAYFQFEFAFNIHLWEQLLRQYPFSAFIFFSLLLFLIDVSGLENRLYVEQSQEKVNAALLEYCLNFYPEMKDKFGQILLRLPEIRIISIRLEEFLYIKHLNNQVPDQTLLTEMLHSKRK